MAKNFAPKNHKHPGGDKMCIGGELRIKKGGKLIVEDDAGNDVNLSEEIVYNYDNVGVRIQADADDEIVSILPYRPDGYTSLNLAHTKENLITAPYHTTEEICYGLSCKVDKSENALHISGRKTTSYAFKYYFTRSIAEQTETLLYCGVSDYRSIQSSPNMKMFVYSATGTSDLVPLQHVADNPILVIPPNLTVDGISPGIHTYGNWEACAEFYPLVGRGEKITKSLGSTVYGGTYNWSTGELVSMYAADGTMLQTPITSNIGAAVISDYDDNWYYSDSGRVAKRKKITATKALPIEKTVYVNSVKDMRNRFDLADGMTVVTLGYYYADDGGGATFKIRKASHDDIDNGGNIIVIGEHTAEMNVDNVGVIDVRKFGARGDNSSDDTDAFVRAIAAFNHVCVSAGKYMLSAPVVIAEGKHVELDINSVITPIADNGIFIMRSNTLLDGYGELYTYHNNPYTSSVVLVENDKATDLQHVTIRDISISGEIGRGTAIEYISSLSQVLYCTIDNVHISRYKYGVHINNGVYTASDFSINLTANYSNCVLYGGLTASHVCLRGETGYKNSHSDYVVDVSARYSYIHNAMIDIGNPGHVPNGVRLRKGSYATVVTGLSHEQTVIDEGIGNYVPLKYNNNVSKTGLSIGDHGYNNILNGLTARHDVTVTLDNCVVSEENHGIAYTAKDFIDTISAMNPTHCWRFRAIDDTVPAVVQIDMPNIRMNPTGFTYEWAKYIGYGFGVGFDSISLYGRENADAEYVLIGECSYSREAAQTAYYGPVFGWQTNKLYADRTFRYKDLRFVMSFAKTENYIAEAYVCALSLFGVHDNQHMAFAQTAGDTMYGDLAFGVPDKGVVLKSPNGTPYRLTVDDSGILTATAVTD